MYFPFLRGKQFELIALRELATLPLNPTLISPIVEPIKNLNSIATAAKILNPLGVNIQLIVNPQYGDFKGKSQLCMEFITNQRVIGVGNLIPTFLIQNSNDFNSFREFRNSIDWENSRFSLVHLKQISEIQEMVELLDNDKVFANIIQVNQMLSLRRRFRNIPSALLVDPFIKQLRNKDYEEVIDEFFSNDYSYFRSEGYSGFGDYLTIGADFIEGGQLPYAVVIHLTYLDTGSGDIRIRHLLSDSNSDNSDTAGKFYEALTKLIDFVDSRNVKETKAITQFRKYFEDQAYPGLGVIKKLSMMHHIELVQSLLQ